MGFRIALPPTYEVKVTVAYPVADGKIHRADFFAEFKRLNQEELEQLIADVKQGKGGDREVLLRVLVGWRGVEDEQGEPLPFNDRNRDALLAIHPAQPTLARAFMDSVASAREKN